MNRTDGQLAREYASKASSSTQTFVGAIAGPTASFGTAQVTSSLDVSGMAQFAQDIVVTGQVRSSQTGLMDSLSTLVTKQFLDTQLAAIQQTPAGTGSFAYVEASNAVISPSFVSSGDSSFNTFTATGNVQFDADVSIGGTLTTAGISIGNVVATSGSYQTLTASTSITTPSLQVSSSATLNQLVVATSSTLQGTLQVNGASSLQSTASVQGLLTAQGGLSVPTNNSALSTLSTTGLASLHSGAVANGFSVVGTSTLGMTNTGALTSASLQVTPGSASFVTASTSGLASLHSLTVANGATVQGVLTASSQFQATSALSTLHSLSVQNGTSLNSLTVSGPGTFQSSVAIQGKATSQATQNADGSTTLATKGWIESTFAPLTGGSIGGLTLTGDLTSTSGTSTLSTAVITTSASVQGPLTLSQGGYLAWSASANVSAPNFSALGAGTRIQLNGTSNNLYAMGVASSSTWLSGQAVQIYSGGQLSGTFDASGGLQLRAGLQATTISSSSAATLASLVVSGSSTVQQLDGMYLNATSGINAIAGDITALNGHVVAQTGQVRSKGGLLVYETDPAVDWARITRSSAVVSLADASYPLFSGRVLEAGSLSNSTLAYVRALGHRFTPTALQISGASSGARDAVLLLCTDSTDYADGGGLRIERLASTGDGGSNLQSAIWHRGTANFRIGTQDAAGLALMTNNTTRLFVGSGGESTFYASVSAPSLSATSSVSAATLALSGKGTSASTQLADSGSTLVTKDFVLPISGGTLTGALSGTTLALSTSLSSPLISGANVSATSSVKSDSVLETGGRLLFSNSGPYAPRFAWEHLADGSVLQLRVYTDAGTQDSVTVPISVSRSSPIVVTLWNTSVQSLTSSTSVSTQTLVSSISSSLAAATATTLQTSSLATLSSLQVTNTATLPTIAGNTSFVGTGPVQAASLVISGSSSTNTLVTSGAASLASGSTTGSWAVGTTLQVGQGTTLNGTLTANDAAVFNSTVQTGALTAGSLVVSSGNAGFVTASTSGLATLNSLSVQTTSSFTGAITAGRVTSSNTNWNDSTLLVTKGWVESNFSPIGTGVFVDLSVTGAMSGNSLSIATSSSFNSATFSGAAVFNSTLTGNGTSNFGTTNLSGVLTTSSTVSFGNNGSNLGVPSSSTTTAGMRLQFHGTFSNYAIGLESGGAGNNPIQWITSQNGWKFYSTSTGSPAAVITILGTGAATFASSISALSVSTSGGISATGASTFGSTVVVTGGATFQSTVGITGAVTMASTCNVVGKLTAGATSAGDASGTVVTKGYAESTFLPLAGGSVSGTLTAGTLVVNSGATFGASSSVNFNNGLTATALTVSTGTTTLRATNTQALTCTSLTASAASTFQAGLTSTAGTTSLGVTSVTNFTCTGSAGFSGKPTAATTITSDAAGTLTTLGFTEGRYIKVGSTTMTLGGVSLNPGLYLQSDGTYTQGLGISRTSGGASTIDHRGTGAFRIGATEAATLTLYSQGADYLVVGLGVSEFKRPVLISGSSAGLRLSDRNGNGQYAEWYRSGGVTSMWDTVQGQAVLSFTSSTYTLSTPGNVDIQGWFNTRNSQRVFADSSWAGGDRPGFTADITNCGEIRGMFGFNSAYGFLRLGAGSTNASVAAIDLCSYSTTATMSHTITFFLQANQRMKLAFSGTRYGLGIGKDPANGYELDLSSDAARKASTTTWAVVSDERIKEDIQDADTARCLQIVRDVKLRYFKWKDFVQVDDRRMLGFIAQEVQPVFSKAVTVGENTVGGQKIDDFLTLNVDQLYKAHYGATQELVKLVEALTARVAALESHLASF